MSLKIKAPAAASGESYEPVAAGTYPAVCTMVVDLGTQESNYQGDVKRQPKIMIAFELGEDAGKRSDGTPHKLNRRYTASMHEKSTLRKDLKSWRGKDFTDAELAEFTPAKLLGKGCMLSVVHTSVGDKTYANISGIMGLPKGLPPVKPSDNSLVFDLDDAEAMTTYATLPEWLQGIIAKSPEYQAIAAGKANIGAAADEEF